MAHDESAVGHALEKKREQRGEIGRWIEIVNTRECRVGGQSEGRGAPAKAAAQQAERQHLEIAEQHSRGQRAAALPHQAAGARRFTMSSTAARICGNSCTCWWPSTKSGARPNAAVN